jgi:transposase
MARPYSLDLRERVVALVADGMSCRDVAELTNIVASTVVKWTQRQRQTGSPAAKAMGGKRPYLLEAHRDWLLQRLREKPDLTLHALGAELMEQRNRIV